VRRFVTVDGSSRVALVALQHDDIVGVARFDRISGTTDAEVALVVDDDRQGNGIGGLLLELIAQRARARGVDRLVAHTLPENTRVRDVFRGYSSDVSSAFVHGLVDVVIPLAERD
jgi:GNAT superfamily N-acetyltransferase